MKGNLNDVFVFVRVVETGSFTAAAKQLSLPKSTVSRRVARLEDALGAQLLHRTTRKLGLTDTGWAYYERCARATAVLDEAERAATAMHGAPKGRLRVTAPVDVGMILVEPVVSEYLGEHPDVQVDVLLTGRYVNLIDEGYDIAIRGGQLDDSTLVARKLSRTRWLLVASPTYLSRRGEPGSSEALSEHDCLVYGETGANQTWKLRSGAVTRSIRVGGRLASNNLDVLKAAAIRGVGITMLPDMSCRRALAKGELVPVLGGDCGREGHLWAVTPSARYVSPKVRAFIDLLTSRMSVLVDDE